MNNFIGLNKDPVADLLLRHLLFSIALSIALAYIIIFHVRLKTIHNKIQIFNVILAAILFPWGDWIFYKLFGIVIQLSVFEIILLRSYFFLFAFANFISPQIEPKKIYFGIPLLSDKYIEFFIICFMCTLSIKYKPLYYSLFIWIFFYIFRKLFIKYSEIQP